MSAPPRTELRRATDMLRIPRRSLLAAVASAAATLASAVALAAVSAWLVTTAWTMPPVLDLSVAVVAVRALGISRGVFRWVDRMTTHDVALRGVVRLRTGVVTALADRTDDALSRLRRGDLLARLGDDVQELGDHVIRAVVPIAVAAVMAVATLALIVPLSLWAAVAMLAALALATIAAPLAAYRSAQLTEEAVITGRGDLTRSVLDVLDDASALRLSGRLDGALEAEAAAQERYDAALDRAAGPAALAAAAVPAATLVALLGSVLAAGQAWLSGGASAGVVGILLLLPLSAFEAATALPAAASQVARSRAAAHRLMSTLEPPERPEHRAHPIAPSTPDPHPAGQPSSLPPSPDGTALLVASDLTAGWSAEKPCVSHLDLCLEPGSRVAILGPSGLGKTTVLLTLAGLLDPLSGSVRLGGQQLRELSEDAVRSQVVMFAEDAHVFATTVRENVRVARGDASDEEILQALADTGLRDWVHSLPGGLDHMLGPDGTTVSGGERRRLLLARALVRRAPVTLLDEPTEHLDPGRARTLLHALLSRGEDALVPADSAVVVVTHQRDALPPGTCVLDLTAHEWSTGPTMPGAKETP